MRDAVKTFLTAMKEREHLLTLIENLEMLVIKLVYEQNIIEMAFHHGEAILLDEKKERSISCEISGEAESIKSLIKGERKLRFLMLSGQLNVIGSFRTILLLETIFYLTKPEGQQMKLIS
jgi:hypothetical protein